VLTPHQGVFDRTAFDDEPGDLERDDLVLEPIVIERPAVWQQRVPAPRRSTQPSMYISEPSPDRPTTRTPQPRATHAHRRRRNTRPAGRGHGIPGRGVICFSALAAFVVAGVDVALNDRLTVFFSLGFILIAVLGAIGVRRSDLFTAGVLPPLLLAGVMGVLAVALPNAIGTPTDSINHAWVAGLADHAGGLISALAAALLIIALRMLNKPAKRTRAF
jgi:hypothetical protein